jgi:hypothetical protein
MPNKNAPSSDSVDSAVRRPCRHAANVNASIHGDKINCFCNDCQIGWHGVMRPIAMLSGKVRKPPRWVQVHIDKYQEDCRKYMERTKNMPPAIE